MSRPHPFWADLGDNRVGPLLRELIEALADANDPHLTRKVARRIRLLSSSLDSMALDMVHDRRACPLCKTGSVVSSGHGVDECRKRAAQDELQRMGVP